MEFYFPKILLRTLRLREEGLTSFGNVYFETTNSVEDALSRITWTDEDVIMDIGCGNGYRTAYIFCPIIKHYKRLLAIDKNPNLINHARVFSRARNLEYFESDIEEVETFMEDWQRGMSKIISINCLHEVENQHIAFQHVFELLPPGGEALLYFKIAHPLPSRIKRYPRFPKAPRDTLVSLARIFDLLMYGSPEYYYRDMCEKIGFQVLLYQEEGPKKRTSANDELAIATYSTAAAPQIRTHSDKEDQMLCETAEELRVLWRKTLQLPKMSLMIPNKHPMLEDVFQIVLKLQEKNSDGQALLKYKMLLLHLRVPKPYYILGNPSYLPF